MKARSICEFSIEGFRSGDELAFDLLFKQLYSALCCFAEEIVEDESVAEEFVQAAFIKLWSKRNQFISLIKIKAFLYVVVKNAAFNHLKKERNRLKAEKQLSEKSIYTEKDVIDKIIHTEVMLVLNKSIEILPDKCRKVIELSYLSDKSSKEIADLMGVSVSTVDNHRARGIQLLKKSLAKAGLLSFLPFLFM